MRLGLLAAARITTKAVVAPAQEVDGVEVVAVAARDPERATAFAERAGVARVEPSYEALVAASDLDAIYVATPAALHRRWTEAALAEGKHVLCEKPIGANAVDAQAMVAAAEAADRVLVEAYHWRYHPLAERVAEIVGSGRLGSIRRVRATFAIPEGGIAPGDIRWDLALGGGALMDLGCYPVQWSRLVAAAAGEAGEPRVVAASAECRSPGVDAAMTAELRWSPSLAAEVRCSMVDQGDERTVELVVEGDDGALVVRNPLAPQLGNSLTVVAGDEREREEIARTSSYTHQLEAFRDAVVHGAPVPTGGEDAVATMRLIDAIYERAGLTPRPSTR